MSRASDALVMYRLDRRNRTAVARRLLSIRVRVTAAAQRSCAVALNMHGRHVIDETETLAKAALDDPILDTGRAIRPYLKDLLEPDLAAQVDDSLAERLTANDARAVRDELERHRPTLEWAAEFVVHGLPPELAVLAELSYSPTAGKGEATPVPKFACPHADYVVFRHAVGQRVDPCPTHHCELVRV